MCSACPAEQSPLVAPCLSQSHLPGPVLHCSRPYPWLSFSQRKSRRRRMLQRGFWSVFILLAILASARGAEQRNSAAQSPRQAIIEMFSGGETQFRKHLTVEMQRKLEATMNESSSAVPLRALTTSKPSDPEHFQAFDLGPILFSFNNPEQHERYEVQIDSEDPRGGEDIMALSLHLIRNGIEEEIPMAVRFILNMKQQEGLWRLNAVTLSATLPLGDPRILEKPWWAPALLAASGSKAESSAAAALVEERPKLTPLRAVRMIGMAENIFAQNHPGIGYTCRMADLVNVGKGLDEDGVYKFMDAEFADGVYNGYRFTLSGCDRKPARTFHVIAEPVAGKGRAYCSDNTNNLRASDDGRGVTCLRSEEHT